MLLYFLNFFITLLKRKKKFLISKYYYPFDNFLKLMNREKSRIIKKSRTKLLEARNKSLVKILNEVQLTLKNKIQKDRNFYADLMINLIVEVKNPTFYNLRG